MNTRRHDYRARIGRRAFLRSAGVGAAGMAGAALIGCGGDSKSSTPAPKPAGSSTAAAGATAAAKSGGTLRYSSIGDPGPLDLMITSSGSPFYFVGPAPSRFIVRAERIS